MKIFCNFSRDILLKMVLLAFFISACFIFVEAQYDNRWWTPEYDQLCQAQTPTQVGKYQAFMRDFNRKCSVFCFFNDTLVRGEHINVPDETPCNDSRVCQHGDCVDIAIVDVCKKLFDTIQATAIEGTCKQICSRKDELGNSIEQQIVRFPDGTPCISASVQNGKGQCINGACENANVPLPTSTVKPDPSRSDITTECGKSFDNSDGSLVGKKDQNSRGCKYHCYKGNNQLSKEALLIPNGADCGNDKDYSCNEGSCQRKDEITKCSNSLSANGRVLVRNNGCTIQCQELSNAGQPGRVANWNVGESEECYTDIGVTGICSGGGCYEFAR